MAAAAIQAKTSSVHNYAATHVTTNVIEINENNSHHRVLLIIIIQCTLPNKQKATIKTFQSDDNHCAVPDTPAAGCPKCHCQNQNTKSGGNQKADLGSSDETSKAPEK